MRSAVWGGARVRVPSSRAAGRARIAAPCVGRAAAAIALLLSVACGSEAGERVAIGETGAAAEASGVTPAGTEHAPVGVVDSVRSIEEELRWFREGLEPAAGLDPAADSREALVEMFVNALARQDTARFVDLLLDRAEYAYLYYPESKFTRPPYRMAPGLMWYLMMENTEKGLVRALRRFGGKEIRLRGFTCADEPERIGENLVWTDCVLDVDLPDGALEVEAFSGIIERDGRYKFIGYANDL